MHRNISRAYDAIGAEHERIRRIHMRILSQGDPKLERRLLRANLTPANTRMRSFFTRSDSHARNGDEC